MLLPSLYKRERKIDLKRTFLGNLSQNLSKTSLTERLPCSKVMSHGQLKITDPKDLKILNAKKLYDHKHSDQTLSFMWGCCTDSFEGLRAGGSPALTQYMDLLKKG